MNSFYNLHSNFTPEDFIESFTEYEFSIGNVPAMMGILEL